TAVRFLDDVIDATPYFSELHVKMQREGTRRVGLGTMGLADALIKMRIAYGSAESLEAIDRIYIAIRDAAYIESTTLAQEKGACGFFDEEQYLAGPFIKQLPSAIRQRIRQMGIRNGVVLTQAPTGTTSLLAGVSSGIEPVYDFAMKRVDRMGEHIIYHPLYQEWLAEHPGEERPVYFVGANDLSPEEHVTVQARVQRYTDASISKTVNGPNDDTVEDVKRLYTLAYELGCKGVTYYRNGSRDAVLTGVDAKPAEGERTVSGEVNGVERGALSIEEETPSAARRNGQATVETVASPMPGWILAGRLKERPNEMAGFTQNIAAPEGKVNITINSDADGPMEVFVNIGRAGSDVAALAEALGRLVSLQLRLPSTMSQEERLRQAANQLRGIGGSRSIGFGKKRVASLPDAVAQAIVRHLDEHPADHAKRSDAAHTRDGAAKNGNGRHSGDEEPISDSPAPLSFPRLTGNLCPQCGSAGSYVMEEGCRKCHNCGHSEC
ncbi:MAG: adenosylcobalamin-dependent ribonucleoside-diphosphate reductase, partial [Ktedonobacterales bacterium]